MIGERVTEAVQALALVVSRVTHDLKNPLAVLLSNLRHLESVIEGEEPSEALRESLAAARRIDRMLDDAVDLVRLLSGKAPRGPAQAVSLADLGHEIKAQLELLVGNRTLEVELPPLTLRTNRELLRRILVAILEHALRHSRGQGVVRLDAQPHATGATLRVVDEGAPFDPELPPSFVEEQLPARRTPPRGCRNDQGLRLFFAGKAARSLGAVTEVRARGPGQRGVVFTLRFGATGAA